MKFKAYDSEHGDGYIKEEGAYLDSQNIYLSIINPPYGLIERNISCREVLFNRFKYTLYMEELTGIEIIKGFSPEPRGGNSVYESVLERLNLNHLFFIEKNNFIMTKYRLDPAIYSLIALVIRDFSKSEAENIPLDILNYVLKGNATYVEADYIFTAFYAYLLSSRKYKDFSAQYWKGAGNGPGRNFYYYLTEHLNIPELNGYKKSSDWWKNPEIKEVLLSIISKRRVHKTVEKIILTLTGE